MSHGRLRRAHLRPESVSFYAATVVVGELGALSYLVGPPWNGLCGGSALALALIAGRFRARES